MMLAILLLAQLFPFPGPGTKANSGGGGGGSITYHNASSEYVANAASGETTSHTINSTLTNGCIIAQITLWEGADGAVTGVTFDGTSMAQLAVSNIDYFGEYRVYIYGLAVGSKAAGTYNVAMAANTTIDQYSIGIMSYNGCHQTTLAGTAASANGTDASAEVTVSSATGELVVATVVKGNRTGAPTGTEVERWDTAASGDDTGWGGEKAGSSSVTFSVTLSGSNQWLMTAVPIKPAS